jgi:3-deoxy-7-phosphoheptulonate synthase
MNGTPAVLNTTGNPECHVILRGGAGGPNYDAASVAAAVEALRAAGLPERVVVDTSHDNSGKDDARQPLVAADLAAQVAGGDRALVGVMMESFLVAGNQKLGGDLTYGQSITDKCMAWDTTVDVLGGLAEAVRTRRSAS